MTIDERLEALTQTVELLAQMHQDNEKAAAEQHKEYAARFLDNERRAAAERKEAVAERKEAAAERKVYEIRFQANETRLGQLMDTMNRLGRIIEIHDARLDDHEQRL